MKKVSILLIIVLISGLIMGLLSACQGSEEILLIIDGDIEGNLLSVNLAEIKLSKYTYDDEGETVKTKGWHITDVIDRSKFLFEDSWIMITSATDGVSALIEGEITGNIFLYSDDGNTLSAKSIDYPPVCSIKNISEITIIAKETVNVGYKILTPTSTEYVSRGNAKLRLYQQMAENYSGSNVAYKYTLKTDLSVSSFTQKEDNTVYFTDYDIETETDLKSLSWENGGIQLNVADSKKEVFGIATGTHKMIYDAYSEMVESIDNGQKVMFILPDGFSWEQTGVFSEYLDLLKRDNARIALSTHLSISPVALAAIVTGETPGNNGVNFDEGESRAVLEPLVPDIFEYAITRGKSVSYLEGTGNLIITSVEPTYALSDEETYNNAKEAIASGKDLIFVHFHDPDDTNHEFGPLSTASRTKVLYIESYIEYLVSQFDGKVIVVPDHGHNNLYDSENKPYGKHGMFTHYDMYVPYYVFNV